MVAKDLFIFLRKLSVHRYHLCHQLGLLDLQCLDLRRIRLLRQLPKDVNGSAVVQCLAHAPGDVLQSEKLVLEVNDLLPYLFERRCQILEGGFSPETLDTPDTPRLSNEVPGLGTHPL